MILGAVSYTHLDVYKRQEINLFFEIRLKLIDIEVADIYEISAIMGVEFKLLKEAIVDMIEQKYIITSQNKLIMTPRGRKACLLYTSRCV